MPPTAGINGTAPAAAVLLGASLLAAVLLAVLKEAGGGGGALVPLLGGIVDASEPVRTGPEATRRWTSRTLLISCQ